MEPFVYLLKASLVLGVCYAAYWLLFRRDTFHQTKRFVLLAGLGLSVALPLLQLAAWQTPVSVEPMQTAAIPLEYWLLLQQSQPVENSMVEKAETCLLAYGLVCGLMAFWLAARLSGLFQLLRAARYKTVDGYRIAIHPQVKTPFSFFHWMLLPENLPGHALHHQVVTHEAAHIRQWHTLDILLMELYLVFFWFNPVAWLHRQQVRLNLEHLADAAVLQAGAESKNYQLNLLKISTSPTHFRLANHFHFSSLKHRIHMMNRPNSPLHARLKYALFPVLLTGLVAAFHLTQAKPIIEMASIRVIASPIPTGGTDNRNSIGKKGTTRPAKQMTRQKTAIQPKDFKETTIRQDTPQPKPAVFIVNGTRMPEDELKKIKPDIIQSTDVLKGKSATDVYGEEGKNGVVVVTLKGNKEPAPVKFRKPLAFHSATIPLYIVDGKETLAEDIEKLDANTIERIDVLKDKAATDKYGEKGRNGVVIITLKKK